MVVTKTRGIAGTILAAAVALGLASPAFAHPDPAPSLPYCEALPNGQAEEEFERERLTLPADWSDFAAASDDWLAIKTKFGTTECIDLAWIGAAEKYETFQDRFAGFEWYGYESFGYRLIDRTGTGTVLETGERPHFSPDGFMIAALQYSESGYGGLEGFGVWYVFDNGLQPVHLNTRLPGMNDWRIERWDSEGSCLHISVLPFDRMTGDEDVESLPRDPYVAGDANGWAIVPGETCPTYDED